MSKKSNEDLVMDLEGLARDRTALGQIRDGIRSMLEAYGDDSDELSDLAEAFDAFEQSRELEPVETEATKLDRAAEKAFFEATGREAQANHESGPVWSLRSLEIRDNTAAVIAYVRRKDAGTWEVFPLPPKNKWGAFL